VSHAKVLPAALMAVALAVTVVAGCSKDKGSSDVVLSTAGKRGKQVSENRGCVACHTSSGSRSTGPTWKDLAGSKVDLTNGTVTADDDYLSQAITDPRSQVVKGYPNIMQEYPSLTKQEISDLVAYLHDLSTADKKPAKS
jgi:cytochrome c oxidase subunit 2